MSDRPDQPIDQEMDLQLRRCFAAVPLPAVPSRFDQKLEKRLHLPARLSEKARRVLAVYALAALAISTWLMRRESIPWPLVILSLVVPVAVIYVACYLRRLRHILSLPYSWR